jgi:hypothetical protein
MLFYFDHEKAVSFSSLVIRASLLYSSLKQPMEGPSLAYGWNRVWGRRDLGLNPSQHCDRIGPSEAKQRSPN